MLWYYSKPCNFMDWCYYCSYDELFINSVKRNSSLPLLNSYLSMGCGKFEAKTCLGLQSALISEILSKVTITV